MIKFFRHIRQSLINQNQMGKYLKYAIGEILLVMIGILLALQVNNWNEHRKHLKSELKLVKQLLADAKADSLFFSSRLKIQRDKDTLFTNLLLINTNSKNDSLLNLPFQVDPFFQRLAFQSNLLNNNPDAYDGIEDDSIKSKLREYKALYDYVANSIDLNNRIMETHGLPLRLKFYSLIKELDDASTLSEAQTLTTDNTAVAYFDLVKRFGINYGIQIEDFLMTNQELIELLKKYINQND